MKAGPTFIYLVLGRKGGGIALIFFMPLFYATPEILINFHATLFYATPKKFYQKHRKNIEIEFRGLLGPKENLNKLKNAVFIPAYVFKISSFRKSESSDENGQLKAAVIFRKNQAF